MQPLRNLLQFKLHFCTKFSSKKSGCNLYMRFFYLFVTYKQVKIGVDLDMHATHT